MTYLDLTTEQSSALAAGQVVEVWARMEPQPPTPEEFPGSVFSLNRAVADGITMYSQNHYEHLPKHPTDWELIGSVGVARLAGFPMRYTAPHPPGTRARVREPWRHIIDDPDDTRWEYQAGGWAESDILDSPEMTDDEAHAEFDGEKYKPQWRPASTMPCKAIRMDAISTATRPERRGTDWGFVTGWVKA